VNPAAAAAAAEANRKEAALTFSRASGARRAAKQASSTMSARLAARLVEDEWWGLADIPRHVGQRISNPYFLN
jgi:hypothetical protein